MKNLLFLLLSAFLLRKKCDLFLLDEPEISLHLEWQKKLIQSLRRLAPDSQFVIVTHSPGIVMKGWMDKTINLGNYTLTESDHE